MWLIDCIVASKSSIVDNGTYIAAYKVENVMYHNNENCSEKQALQRVENLSDCGSIDSVDEHVDVIDYLPHYVGK